MKYNVNAVNLRVIILKLIQILFFSEDWTLKISPILLEDDAMFQCQVGAADGVRPIRSKFAKLTVYVPPGDPFIVQGHTMEATEDREVRLECVSPGGKPAADVSYLTIFRNQYFPKRSRNP